MGCFTQRHIDYIDGVVTESYVYASANDLGTGRVRRVKVLRSLWDTGASSTLISTRVARALELKAIGKSGVSGFNIGIDIKDTYYVHIGLPTGDVVTDVEAMEFDGEEYDVVIGMDIICKGDFALSNTEGKKTFSFRIPSEEEIVF